MTEQPGSDRPDPDSSPAPGYGSPPGSYPGQTPYPGQPQYPGPAPYPGQSPYPSQSPYPGQAPTPGYQPQPPPYQGQAPQQPPYGYPGQSGYASPDPNAYLGAPAYPGYGGAGMAPPTRGFSGWAIAAFITGLIPLIGIVAALPLGIVALVKIAKTGDRGKWLAIIGMVVSGLWWIGIVALGLWVQSNQAQRDDNGVITEEGTLDFGDVRRGDCVRIPALVDEGTVGAFDLKGVPCADEHNAQALFVVNFPDSDYPGKTGLERQSALACGPKYAAENVQPTNRYFLYPTEDRWNQTDGHRSICFITNGGEPMTGSAFN